MKNATLAKKFDFWIEHDLNVLLEGGHGIGKTELVTQAFKRNNIKYRYFSAATMDPWVDFIGVPKEKVQENGVSYLELVRPKDFQDDEVEAIFMDEFNRAPSKVRNAVMELLQFKSINGREFKNLRFIWAAVNPADDEDTYDVDRIDPAQQDRFQVQFALPAEPNEEYFAEKYKELGPKAIDWWGTLPTEIQRLVSPRRLDYALDFFIKGGDLKDVLPPLTKPAILKAFLTRIDGDATLTSEQQWRETPDLYIADLSSRKSKKSVIEPFKVLGEMCMDQAVGYVEKLTSAQKQELATEPYTLGILIRAVGSKTTNQKTLTRVLNSVTRTGDFDYGDIITKNKEKHAEVLKYLTYMSEKNSNMRDEWTSFTTILGSGEEITDSRLLCVIVEACYTRLAGGRLGAGGLTTATGKQIKNILNVLFNRYGHDYDMLCTKPLLFGEAQQ